MFLLNFAVYAFISSFLSGSVILNAYTTHLQFYSTVIHLVKFKFSLLVLLNFVFVIVLSVAKFLKWLIFGRLRTSEVELLLENIGCAITETCLALTIFRDDLNLQTGIVFSLLLFCKSFHCLVKARVEHLEQNEDNFRVVSTQITMFSFIAVLMAFDLFAASISLQSLRETGITVNLIFGFEFFLLFLSGFTTLSRYILRLIDS